MPAIFANANKFSQNTDYPFDKVIFESTGSYFVAPSSSDTRQAIPHNLPFTPLPSGNWSLTQDFSISYEFSTGTFPTSVPGFLYDTVANVFSDSKNVYISADNINAAGKTIFYRVFGYQPSNDNSIIPTVNKGADKFMLNTDYKNTKLYKADVINLPAGGSGGQEVVISHSFGYTPQMIAWIEANGFTHPIDSRFSLASTTALAIGPRAAAFEIQPFELAERAHYRLYIDQ